ncbi:MAG: hypothetical protein JWM43_3530 [Acidobacteriaceae bacterium]|nr:hypothetical protein [Acidobacteriaceae bacterium]
MPAAENAAHRSTPVKLSLPNSLDTGDAPNHNTVAAKVADKREMTARTFARVGYPSEPQGCSPEKRIAVDPIPPAAYALTLFAVDIDKAYRPKFAAPPSLAASIFARKLHARSATAPIPRADVPCRRSFFTCDGIAPLTETFSSSTTGRSSAGLLCITYIPQVRSIVPSCLHPYFIDSQRKRSAKVALLVPLVKLIQWN